MVSRIFLVVYVALLAFLSLYGVHRYWILYLYWRHYKKKPPPPIPPDPSEWPDVTIQLPLFNEYFMAPRLLEAVCALDYPKSRLHIQVLDDSTDETRRRAGEIVREKKALGFRIDHILRDHRKGFKAGALAEGMKRTDSDFIAIFDADFVPPPDFLRRTIPHFIDEKLGMVQTRWGHLNRDYSLLTRLQAYFLDGHFILEHTARNRSGAFSNFNGSAGVWRKKTIEDAGGWSDDTLTEDLDISYRAQLRGWKFLHLPDVICPAELPVDIGAFRSQQRRWTQGALQVALKILPRIWKAPLPLRVKLESTSHLTVHIGYPLSLLLSLFVLPSALARHRIGGNAVVNIFELGAFILTTISILVFYAVVRREEGLHDRKRHSLRDLPAALALGLGMCVNNSGAVVTALLGKKTEFHRTPKLNVLRREDTWDHGRYRPLSGGAGWPEMATAVYFAGTLLWIALSSGRSWLALPFMSLFFFGNAYVGILSFTHGLRK